MEDEFMNHTLIELDASDPKNERLSGVAWFPPKERNNKRGIIVLFMRVKVNKYRPSRKNNPIKKIKIIIERYRIVQVREQDLSSSVALFNIIKLKEDYTPVDNSPPYLVQLSRTNLYKDICDCYRGTKTKELDGYSHCKHLVAMRVILANKLISLEKI